MSGLFVVFEGGDSAGKSTQVQALAATLASNGVDHLVTRQPGGTGLGAAIRELVLDPANTGLTPAAEALLYCADKAQHVKTVVLPALRAGQVVVCDRYVDSMLAYQGAGRGLAFDDLEHLARWATGGLRADLTVLLDVDPAQAVAQVSTKDRLEAAGEDFHRRVRQGFLRLAQADEQHYLVLPARDSIASIAAAVRHQVAGLLGRELR